MIGQQFGRLTVTGQAPNRGKHRVVLCECVCGRPGRYQLDNLRSGSTRSCGCLQRENRARERKHGNARSGARSFENRVWNGIVTRCLNPKATSYERYGGRGITICSEWRSSFERFLCDVGQAPSQRHTIERIDNERGYEPGNVRWATRREQSRNTSANVNLTYNGRTACLTDWAMELGIKVPTLSMRLKNGWSVERALTEGTNHGI